MRLTEEELRVNALLEYRGNRQLEYPSFGEFADALVHKANGDNTKFDAYVAACNAVKAKYPKPL